MKTNISIFFISCLVLLFACKTNTDNNSDSGKSEISESETVVKYFIESLGRKDFETAFTLQQVESWGTFSKFSSTKAFGGINATSINEIQTKEETESSAVVFVDAYYYDPINGDNRYKQLFHLKKKGTSWKIQKLEILKNSSKTGEYQIKEIVKKTDFFENDINEKKNEHIIYSFKLQNSNTLYLCFTSNVDCSSHATGTMLSAFVFDKDNVMIEKSVKCDEIGSYGSAPEKSSIEILNFGQNSMIRIESGFTNMGIIQTNQLFYIFRNGIFKNIGNIITDFADTNAGMFETDSKYESWESMIEYINSKAIFPPDIKLEISAQKDGQDFSETRIYKYNGTEYIEY